MDFLAKYNNINNQSRLDTSNAPDTYTRQRGGIEPKRKQPSVSGYWYLALIPPSDIITNSQEATKIFNGAAEGFTPPSKSITKQEIVAFSGIKKNVITGQDISNSFSITFREIQDNIVHSLIQHWASSINPYVGHIKKRYKGQCIVIFAKPTFGIKKTNEFETLVEVNNVSDVYYFDGVFPEEDPISKFNSDINTNETITIDTSFNFDSCFMNRAFDLDGFINDYNEIIGEFKEIKPYMELPVAV